MVIQISLLQHLTIGPHIRKMHNHPVTAMPLCMAYGRSELSPSEKGMSMKAEEALESNTFKQILLTVADTVDTYS